MTPQRAPAGTREPAPAAGHAGHRDDDWDSGPCEALGHRFRVRAPAAVEPALLARLSALTRPLRAGVEPDVGYEVWPDPPGGPPWTYTLLRDGEPVCGHRAAAATAGFLAWDVNRCAVAAAAVGHTVLHAAAAAAGGEAVILAAPMERGKTTTVAGLLAAGWDYVTDEAVALRRADLLVPPFPKALALDRGSWPLFPQARPGSPGVADTDTEWHLDAGSFGSRVATAAVPPALVVFPAYRPGARTAATPVHPAETVTRLAAVTFDFLAAAEENLDVLVRLARRCPAYALTIGDLDEAVSAIAGLWEEEVRA